MYKIVKLKFPGYMHIGSNRCNLNVSDSIIHSDTLFSALINAASREGIKEAEEIVNLFDTSKLTITSAFPYKDKTFFFPKSMELNNKIRINFEKNGGNFDANHKNIKKTEMISLDCLDSLKQGKSIVDTISKEKENQESIFSFQILPRISVDRSNNTTTLFQYLRVRFMTECGLFFFLKYEEEKHLERINDLLEMLKDFGIGGERSIGNGQFLFSIESCPDKLVSMIDTESVDNISLSLLYPEDIETFKKCVLSYELIKRSGFVFSFISDFVAKRKSIIMVKEGAHFNKRCGGAIADVTPKNYTTHKVLKYGKSLYLSI